MKPCPTRMEGSMMVADMHYHQNFQTLDSINAQQIWGGEETTTCTSPNKMLGGSSCTVVEDPKSHTGQVLLHQKGQR